MGGRGHGPVIVTQDTLVVVFEGLTADFSEQAGLVVFHGEPALGEAQGAARLSPDAGELRRESYFQPIGPFVSDVEPVLPHDKMGSSFLSFAIRVVVSAHTNFSTSV